MPLQPFVRQAIEQMQQDAQALLNGDDALTNSKQRTLITSIEGCIKILLTQYHAYAEKLASPEAWLEEIGYYQTLIPFSWSILGSIGTSCAAFHLLPNSPPLNTPQLQRLEAIENNQKAVALELERYMHQEWVG